MSAQREIKDFVEGFYDGPHATPKESDHGPIFLGIKNVTPDGRLDFSEIRHVSPEEYPRWTKRVVPQKDDIVFSYEATLHRYALIPEGFVGCLGRRMALIRPDRNKVNPRFLHYYMLSSAWRKEAEASVISGATVDRIPLTKVPNFKVDFPSLTEQEIVAEILLSYDDLIENNKRRIELLEESARQLYKEWFVRFRFPGHEHVKIIDGVPEGWMKTAADQAMDILSGGTPKTSVPDYWDGEIGFFTPKDTTGSVYVSTTEKTITTLGLEKCASNLYPKNTLFITARGTVGNLNLAQKPMAMNQSCYALIGREPINQFYLYFAMQAGIQQVKSRAVGAVFDAIIKDTFKVIPFLIPPKGLVEEFTDFVQPMLTQIDTLMVSTERLVQARDLLLPKLMNGEIAV